MRARNFHKPESRSAFYASAMMRQLSRASLLCLAAQVSSAKAQLPLSIETLLMPPSTFTVSTQAHWRQARQPVLARRNDDSGGAFLSLGHRSVEQGIASVGARYGVSRRLELKGRVSHRQTRWRTPGNPAISRRGYRAAMGLSWLLQPERGAPAVLLDAEVDLLSRAATPGAGRAWLDGVGFGVTTYRSLDPVVLSLSANYRRQRERSLDPGGSGASEMLVLAPQVNFAVNAQVTLVGGLSVQYQTGNVSPLDDRGSTVSTALRLGIGYAAGRRTTLFLNTNVATSGADRGAGFDLEWLYRF